MLIDALACRPGQSGILTHGQGLVRGIAGQDDLAVTVVTGSPEEFAGPGVTLSAAPARTRSFAQRALWREAALPTIARRTGARVVVSTVPELPQRRLAVPAAMVVHDLVAVVAPALYPVSKRLRYELLLRGACRRATHIVCVSHATLLDLHRWAGIDPGRCSVIGNGPQPLPPGPERPDPRDPYVLLVGNVYDNKNTGTMVRAMALVRSARSASRLPAPRLVMVGPLSGPAASRLRAEIRAVGVEDGVEHRGYVGREDLGVLYRRAAAVVYPSLYEGQGIPVMEAAMAGVPVIASDLPPIREFAGEGVTLVDRILDPTAWASAILEVLGRPVAGTPRSSIDAAGREREIGRAYAELVRRLAATAG